MGRKDFGFIPYGHRRFRDRVGPSLLSSPIQICARRMLQKHHTPRIHGLYALCGTRSH
jgi:hypothetical protein